MTRVGMLLLVALALPWAGCSGKAVKGQRDTGTPWLSPHGIRQESDPDTVEYLMDVQRFKHENGRLPTADERLNR